jgi:hypothetical protein
MKKILLAIILSILLIGIVSAVDFDPAGDINNKGRWAIKNVTNITITGSNNVVINNTGFWGTVFWSKLSGIPSYVRDYTNDITGNVSVVYSNVYAAIAGNRTQIETNTNSAINGNISQVNTAINNNFTSLNNSKLDKTDQRYNETSYINGINSTLDNKINNVNSSTYNWVTNNFLKIVDMFTKNQIVNMISGNRTEIETNTNNAINGNISKVNTAINNNVSNLNSAITGNVSTLRNDINNNYTELDTIKMNKSDQRYNDTEMIIAVNDTAKDKYNSTYDITTNDVSANRSMWFNNESFNQSLTDGLYYSNSNPKGYINSTNYTNVAFTNQTTSWGIFNLTASYINAFLEWSNLKNIPAYVKDWDYKLNETDQRYNDTGLALAVNDTAKNKFNTTYDTTTQDVNANRSAWFSTYNNTYNTYAYNQSDLSRYNSTYDTTTNNVNANQSNWNSKYNATYNTWAYNQTYSGSTYNVTYNGLINAKLNTSDQRYNDSTKADYNFGINNFNGTGNFNTSGDIITTGYLMGQPLLGMLGSGIIQSNQTNLLSEVNVTCSGLNCSYNQFEVRLVSGTSDQNAKYCKIPSGSRLAPDNTHSVFYIDDTCTIQSTTIESWYGGTIQTGGLWDFANMVCYNGVCEVSNGIGLEQRRMMKQRVLDFNEMHLKVVSGLDRQISTFPGFNITSGKYIYLMDVVTTTSVNANQTGTLEYVYHNSSQTSGWTTIDTSGIQLTQCDNNSDLVTCTGNNWRRYYIYVIGWNETGKTTTGIHQTAALLGTTYGSLATCLDTNANPLVYNIPSWYTTSAVPLYAYCARRTDTSTQWLFNNFIDLRTVKTGSSSLSALETDPVWTSEKVNYNTIALDWINDSGSFAGIQWGYNFTTATYNLYDSRWYTPNNGITLDTNNLTNLAGLTNKTILDWTNITNKPIILNGTDGVNGTNGINGTNLFTSINQTQMDNSTGVLNIIESWLRGIITGYTGTANLHTHDTNNLTNVVGLNNKITIQGENITGGTIGIARLPSLTNSVLSDISNVTNGAKAGSCSAGQYASATTTSGVTCSEVPIFNSSYLTSMINDGITISADNITAGTIAWARLPTFTDTLTLHWLNITNKPVACSAGQYVSQVGDTNTCSAPSGTTDAHKHSISNLTVGQMDVNINMSYKNITDVNYIKFQKIAGACDLTINGSICSNSTGTYIIG